MGERVNYSVVLIFSLWSLYWYLKISCSIAAFSCYPVTTGSLQRVAPRLPDVPQGKLKTTTTANSKMLQRRPIHNGNRKKNAIKAHKKPKQLISLAVVFFCHTAQMKPLLPLSVSQYSLHILVSVTSAAVPSHFCWVSCAFSYLLVGCFFYFSWSACEPSEAPYGCHSWSNLYYCSVEVEGNTATLTHEVTERCCWTLRCIVRKSCQSSAER